VARNLESFRNGMRHSYVERRDVIYDYRFDDCYLDRLPDLAAETVRRNPSVIVSAPLPANLAGGEAGNHYDADRDGEQRWWNFETERLSGFEVDDQLVFGRLPNRALGVTMLPLSRPSKAVDMPDRGSYWGPGLNSPSCSTWPRQGRPSVRWSRRA
jgi:hypothetical protein